MTYLARSNRYDIIKLQSLKYKVTEFNRFCEDMGYIYRVVGCFENKSNIGYQDKTCPNVGITMASNKFTDCFYSAFLKPNGLDNTSLPYYNLSDNSNVNYMFVLEYNELKKFLYIFHCRFISDCRLMAKSISKDDVLSRYLGIIKTIYSLNGDDNALLVNQIG